MSKQTTSIRANRPATIEHRRFQIRMMASAIVRQGVPFNNITSLADLVDLENFRSGIQLEGILVFEMALYVS